MASAKRPLKKNDLSGSEMEKYCTCNFDGVRHAEDCPLPGRLWVARFARNVLYHEAGHAVAAVVMWGSDSVVSVEINLHEMEAISIDDEWSQGGAVKAFRDPKWLDRSVAERIKAMATVCYAGASAQMALGPESLSPDEVFTNSWHDRAQLEEFARNLGHEVPSHVWWDAAMEEATSLVKEYWEAIEAVADRLCSYPDPFKVSGQEVDNIVQYAALDLDSPRHIIPDPVA